MHDHRGALCGWVAMQGWRRPMALNGTGIEFAKSEHVFTCGISRATTTSAEFIVLGQWCGVQVVGRKVGHMSRPPPVAVRARVSPRQRGHTVCFPFLSLIPFLRYLETRYLESYGGRHVSYCLIVLLSYLETDGPRSRSRRDTTARAASLSDPPTPGALPPLIPSHHTHCHRSRT
jgi:hypothetical protein